MAPTLARVPEDLRLFSSHYRTREKMPNDIVAAMLAPRQRNTALNLLNQLRICLFNLAVNADPGADL